ncbi:hypothetical protein CAPTEDRAFT_90577 [Capitella teleta]|uniref:Protein kinase domain-containing protein n=1 Tax=Capitella teleta TaxID=283909 RepID=R7VLI1_CAPTE|nr:hypothetical protein CAPTEDRAFT_90577 [Capitella teleta]|eukprot:ELU18286.1 hypothetical protein CAPTEDRAFT_90577 [Capitella teleta]
MVGFIHGPVIGHGSFSTVRASYSQEHNTRVAVKVIDQKKASDNFWNRFLPRELAILSKIRHPNIIHFYEAHTWGTRVVVVMELATRGDLLELLGLNPDIKESIAKRIFKQVVDGVEYLHNNGIVHRDLKAENVLLTDPFVAKVADFGLARHFDGDQMLETMCGSAAYAAPEVLTGRGYFGPPCDVWSLGVVLFVTVCHSMPFDDTKLKAMVLAQKNRAFQFPKKRTLSDDLKALIQSMLEPQVETRTTLPDIRESPWVNNADVTDPAEVEDLKFPPPIEEEDQKEASEDESSADPEPSTSSSKS